MAHTSERVTVHHCVQYICVFILKVWDVHGVNLCGLLLRILSVVHTFSILYR